MTSTQATDTIVLDRTYSVGAYWGPRATDPTTGAKQVLRLLSSLTALESTLGEWRREDGTVESAPVPDDPEKLGEQLLARTREKQVSSGIDGYFVANDVAVAVRLGMTSPHLGNAVFLKPSRQPKAFWLAKAKVLVTTLVDVFDPEWGIAAPSALRRAQKTMPEPDIGAVTYLTGEVEMSDVPRTAHISQYGSGSLIDLTANGERLPTVTEVLDVRGRVLGQA